LFENRRAQQIHEIPQDLAGHRRVEELLQCEAIIECHQPRGDGARWKRQ